MSYNMSIVDEKGHIVRLKEKHNLRGGTYAVGGEEYATFNITYNYSEVYALLCGPDFIKNLDGMTIQESIGVLMYAISKLGTSDPYERDYWAPTLGNARAALEALLTLAESVDGGYWHVS